MLRFCLLWDASENYQKLTELEETLHQVKLQNIEEVHSAEGRLNQDMSQFVERSEELLASGLATAMVDAFSQGEQSFKKFAATRGKSRQKPIRDN